MASDHDYSVIIREYEEIVGDTFIWPVTEDNSQNLNNHVTKNDFEARQEDEKDDKIIHNFYDKQSPPCCKNECQNIIPRDVALEHRLNFKELDKADQDLIILAYLRMHRRIKILEKEYGRDSQKSHSRFSHEEGLDRHFIKYFFADLQICRNMFLFLHDLGIKRFKNLQLYFDENGLTPRIHKLTEKTPTRASVLSISETKEIVSFLTSYAEKFALPLPGRLPNVRDFNVLQLPSSDNKSKIYNMYIDAIKDDPLKKKIAESTFRSTWNKYCSHIVIMKPSSDLCDVCRVNNLEITKSANESDDIKAKKLNAAVEHLNCAQTQRDFYNLWRKKARTAIDLCDKSLLVISFDFAQNVSYPSSPQQVGSSYFKALRKCGIFGIHNEGSGVQTNFLIDEEDNTAGKGANAVISMLEYYLNKFPVDHVVLFADNCVGQNKNNAMVHYLLWRVMQQKNKKISLNFLLTGHTKFGPDRNFGILKAKFCRANVDCLQDLIEVVTLSSPGRFNIALPTVDPLTKEHNIAWKHWDTYLKNIFKSMPGVTRYHHFEFHESGLIKAKLFANTAEEIIHEPNYDVNFKASVLKEFKSSGLSLDRQWYLFDQVRNLCYKESSKDLIAPKPRKPKPKKRCSE